jgi:enoyl-CoA hydratase
MDLILTGRPISGAEAFSWGIANRLVENQDEVMKEALNLAKTLSELPQECMRSDRMSLIESVYGSLEKDLRNEMRLGMRVVNAGNSTLGAQKFTSSKGPRPKL